MCSDSWLLIADFYFDKFIKRSHPVKTAIAHAEALPPTNLGGFIDVTKNAHSRYISINFL
ncbi:hypothetical protein LC653_36630 [Nostoc sp. CHAB 5784]|uniref:hypothetical protein n=1 Tax=Nostoc mirabile TaxID=2907820 RepID=UPI001E4583AB|nr:hypothetical protein [Nostoc mirabile]MCC5669221.1 hypothetical protein [Nostoc mirabile CHAB5784]